MTSSNFQLDHDNHMMAQIKMQIFLKCLKIRFVMQSQMKFDDQ